MIGVAATQNGRDAQRAQESADQAARARRDITPVEFLAEPDRCLTMAHSPGDPRCERIRVLRTELLLRRESLAQADIVALLSPCAEEGRSQLAAELAIAFAQTGRPTLLVDADFRQPRQHALFGVDNRSGLSQVLESGVAPRLHAVRGLPRMSLLTAGAAPDNPLELLSSSNFASLLEGWRSEFKFVVIDTPPAMYFADGLAVASLVGRVLALSRAQHTPFKDMQYLLRRLAATRSKILGAVINHF